MDSRNQSVSREAVSCGNGTIGASVYGGVAKETVLLHHVGYGDQHVPHLLLGSLHLFMPACSSFEDYNRTLNSETSEVVVSWSEGSLRYERALSVSRTDDLIVCEIRCSSADSISCIVELDVPGNGKPTAFRSLIELALAETKQVVCKDNFLYYAVTNASGADFGAVARVVPEGGSMASSDGALLITEANRVLVYLKLFIDAEDKQPWDELRSELGGITAGYAELLDSM